MSKLKIEICCLCAGKQEIAIKNYNSHNNEEWHSLAKTICGYLGQCDGINLNSNSLCTYCHQQAKATQHFMRLVETGQCKWKQLLLQEKNVRKEQISLMEETEISDIDVILETSRNVKQEPNAEYLTIADSEKSDMKARGTFIGNIEHYFNNKKIRNNQNDIPDLEKKRFSVNESDSMAVASTAPDLIAELRSPKGVTLATILEVQTKKKKYSSYRTCLVCASCDSAFCGTQPFWQHFEMNCNKTHANRNTSNFKGEEKYLSQQRVILPEACAAAPDSKNSEFGALSSPHSIFVCRQCHKSFANYYAVIRHYRTLHRMERIFKCAQCDASFKSKSSLDYHYAKHSGNKPNKCATCNKSFIAKHELIIHMRIHTGEKPYKCEFCNKSFAHRTNMVVHSRLHTKLRPFKCTTCDARFNTASHYKHHQQMHLKQAHMRLKLTPVLQQSPKDNIKCLKLPEIRLLNYATSEPIKEYKTTRKNMARSLLKWHTPTTDAPHTLHNSSNVTECDHAADTTKERPQILRVDILPALNLTKKFKNSTKIAPPASTTPTPIAHKPSDVYKFQCTYCFKYFKQKSALTKHIRTHSGEKPYKCPLCPKSFADPSNFRRHKILHKNATDALRSTTASISLTTLSQQARVQRRDVTHSPTHSIASDPDPDGLELMQRVRGYTPSSSSNDDSSFFGDDSNWSTYGIEAPRIRQTLPALLGLAGENVHPTLDENKQLIHFTYEDSNNAEP